ncbi:hypothetical protein [Cohnella yongneupensis]|uniref:ABC transporter permease n=1 Tax=Cohnella yongneupensis TaxID=425006 RepID=A0ABW0R2L3_9BACL
MSYWQAARMLSGHLWRREWLGVLGTLAFSLYMGSVMSINVGQLFSGDEVAVGLRVMVDWLYLVLVPIFGTVMNCTIFSIWRNDLFTKKLAILRAYPIPVSVIVGSRIGQSVVMVVTNIAIALSLQYALAPDLRAAVSGIHWFEFGVILASYSLIVNALYILLEQGYSGKRYVQGYLIWFGIVTAGVIALGLLDSHRHFVTEALGWTESGASPAVVACALLCAGMALALCYRKTVNRIRSRSITF